MPVLQWFVCLLRTKFTSPCQTTKLVCSLVTKGVEWIYALVVFHVLARANAHNWRATRCFVVFFFVFCPRIGDENRSCSANILVCQNVICVAAFDRHICMLYSSDRVRQPHKLLLLCRLGLHRTRSSSPVQVSAQCHPFMR